MSVKIQVVAWRGGIGTSTFSYNLAKANDSPTLLLDTSAYSGGIRWVSGAGEINTSWPTLFGDQWNDNLILQFDRLLFKDGNISLFSGCVLPPAVIVSKWLQSQGASQFVVVDGQLLEHDVEYVTIHHTTNSLQEWSDFSGDNNAIYVVQIRVGGLPKKYFTDELQLRNVFFYSYQKAVKNSLELGLGVHVSSKVFKVAKIVLEHVNRR